MFQGWVVRALRRLGVSSQETDQQEDVCRQGRRFDGALKIFDPGVSAARLWATDGVVTRCQEEKQRQGATLSAFSDFASDLYTKLTVRRPQGNVSAYRKRMGRYDG